jgi:L-asparagine oxygenase
MLPIAERTKDQVHPFATTDEHILLLTDEEREEVRKIIELMPPRLDVRSLHHDLLNQIQVQGLQVPSRIAEALLAFKRKPNETGTLLLRNLPTDPILPNTPNDGFPAKEKTSFVSEYSLLVMMLFLGDPISYAEEKNGQLIHDICPIKGSENKIENSGSQTYFSFHTEDAIHPFRPDYLGLVCLRADHDRKAKTDTASIIKAMRVMPSAAIELLRQPLYRLHAPTSFGCTDLSRTVSILTGSLLQPEMCMNAAQMEGIHAEAQWALDTLNESLHQVSAGHVLLPGDLVIIDNRLAAHGRTSFKPRYDGEDRWLQRMFVVTDFRRSSYARSQGSHVCMPLKVQLRLESSPHEE